MFKDSEYVDLLVQIVQTTTSASRPYVTAAALGQTLRNAVSDQSWRDFGYRTLGELLRSPKVQAHLEILETDKEALAVRPRKGLMPPELLPVREYNSLKKEVWGAFVMATPAGLRYLNKKTGSVRVALQMSPVPADEWAEIPPITPDTQKAWAQEFLDAADFDVSSELKSTLERTNWNHAFTVALGSRGGDWNRFRSSKVAEVVDNWATHSGISHDLVFQSRTDQFVTCSSPRGISQASTESDRDIILAVLAKMPIERLREIDLPAGALLDALRSR